MQLPAITTLCRYFVATRRLPLPGAVRPNTGAAPSRILRKACSLNILVQKTRPCGCVETAARTAQKTDVTECSCDPTASFQGGLLASRRVKRIPTFLSGTDVRPEPVRTAFHQEHRVSCSSSALPGIVHTYATAAWSFFLPVAHSTENTVSSWCNAVQQPSEQQGCLTLQIRV